MAIRIQNSAFLLLLVTLLKIFTCAPPKPVPISMKQPLMINNRAVDYPDLSAYSAKTPHPRALSVPDRINLLKSNPLKFFPALVDYLIEDIDDPYLRVKILHDWVALNLSYDIESYRDSSIPQQSVQNVLSSGKAVCAGFASIFTELCRTAGFEVREISGYSRGFGWSIVKWEKFDSNHAWNAVFINGFWHLIDATWDGGYCTDDYKYVKKYSTKYLFIEPKHIIYTHFPELAMDQFLTQPLTFSQFTDLPQYRGDMFQYGIYPVYQYPKTLTVKSSLEMKYRINQCKDYMAIAEMINGWEIKDIDYISIKGDTLSFWIYFPEATDYVLKLYVKQNSLDSLYWEFARFKVNVSHGTAEKPVKFYQKYDPKRFELIAPLTQPLEASDTVCFEFNNTTITELLLIWDDSLRQYLKISELWTQWSVDLPVNGHEKLTVYIWDPVTNIYQGIAEYSIACDEDD